MFQLVGKVSSVVFLVIVIAIGVVIGVRFLPEGDGRSGSVDSYRYLLADRVAESLAESLIEETKAQTIAVLPVSKDQTNEVTELIESRIRGAGPFDLIDPGDVEDALEEILEDREDKTVNRSLAIDLGKKLGADAVVLGSLKDFSEPRRDRPAEIDLVVNVVGVEEGKPLIERSFADKLDRKLSFAYFAASMKETSGWLRLLIWFGIVFTLPFATYFFVKRVTKMENNAANLALLAGYTVFDLILALFLVGFVVSGFWTGLLIFLGFLAAAAWNFLACTIVYEMGK